MTFNKGRPREAYVWIWLPDEIEPVVAGRIEMIGSSYVFNYGRSYLQRRNSLPIFTPELPLRAGAIEPEPPLLMANCLRDAAPDAWGRRVIANRLTGLQSDVVHYAELDELTFMLESGSDRVGALDFQRSATGYEPRAAENTSLNELLDSAERVEQGLPLAPELALALQHGTAIGGARPKALIQTEGTKYVAKFSSSADIYNMVKAEFVAMTLAELAGLKVARVQLTTAMQKDVLLVERFDRTGTDSGWVRHAMVSSLTIFGLDELMAAHASYQNLADSIRLRFTDAGSTLRELFSRLTFNILVGNTDDHARNHAAFWDGESLTLTPAYDICPQTRTGREASQGMLIFNDLRRSQLSVCLEAAHVFLLHEDDAAEIIANQVTCIREHWDTVCRSGGITEAGKAFLWRLQFLNPFAFEGVEERLKSALAGLH